jgi:hypothetical protein
MSNAFTNFLGSVGSGLFSAEGDLRDYQHASRLYVQNNYARAPKAGFMFFVAFTLDEKNILNQKWREKGLRDFGYLVKRCDLPKFTIKTETLNQYNRKTVVQTGLNYAPISMEFHDDNSNITRGFWENYLKYYYVDSIYGDKKKARGTLSRQMETPDSFGDTKYGSKNYDYGFNNYQSTPLIKKIDIYVLHKKRFSQFTLVNPLISECAFDSLDQSEGSKILGIKMNVAYEAVLFSAGKIRKGRSPEGLTEAYYDVSPSPLTAGGLASNQLFGAGGVLNGLDEIFGEEGDFEEASTPLDYLGLALRGATIAKSIGQMSKAGLKQEGYSILTGVLGNIAASGNQPGSPRSVINEGLTSAGRVGVNLFSSSNSGVNNTTPGKPSNLTGRGGLGGI